MKRHIVIIQGHPDRTAHHLGHSLADAYERGAIAGGHEVRRIDVALRLTGFGPVRTSMIGSVEGRDQDRKIRWVARMQALGAAAR